LRSIPASATAPEVSFPLTSFVVPGKSPPRLITEVRPVGDEHDRAWHVTISAGGHLQQLLQLPRFTIHRIARRPVKHLPNIVTNAFRPNWVGFVPEPQRASRITEPVVKYRGKQMTPISITGKDDRRLYNDTRYPWGSVCRVTSGPGHGSGVLIGPRHVLTASHVVDWNAGWAVVEVFRFDGTFSAGSCCSRLSAFTKIDDDPDNSTVDEDYAVLTLFDRLGDQFGYMGSHTYDSSWDEETWWRTIGYPDDLGGGVRPTFEQDFDLDEEPLDYGPARAMTCGADLMRGHSGGPIFAFWPDGFPYVVAVVSAEGGGDNYCAGGSWLGKLIQEARSNDP
jgi:V8-like Glu-specific endopeptidase